MDNEKLKSLKNLLYVDTIDNEVEDSIFVMYKQQCSQNGAIPTINMEIKRYIRLDGLPEDLEQAVREHFGISK